MLNITFLGHNFLRIPDMAGIVSRELSEYLVRSIQTPHDLLWNIAYLAFQLPRGDRQQNPAGPIILRIDLTSGPTNAST